MHKGRFDGFSSAFSCLSFLLRFGLKVSLYSGQLRLKANVISRILFGFKRCCRICIFRRDGLLSPRGGGMVVPRVFVMIRRYDDQKANKDDARCSPSRRNFGEECLLRHWNQLNSRKKKRRKRKGRNRIHIFCWELLSDSGLLTAKWNKPEWSQMLVSDVNYWCTRAITWSRWQTQPKCPMFVCIIWSTTVYRTTDACMRDVEIPDRMRRTVFITTTTTFELGISRRPFALLHRIIESPAQILRRQNVHGPDPSLATLCCWMWAV